MSLRRADVVGRRQSGGAVCAGEPRDALVTMAVASHRIYVASRATKASLCRVGVSCGWRKSCLGRYPVSGGST